MKTAEQQAALMIVSLRDRLVRSRTQLSNAIRGHAAEFGLIAARGVDKIGPLLARIADDATLPALARGLFAQLGMELAQIEARLKQVNAELAAWHRQNELSQRLTQIPGVGPITAAMLARRRRGRKRRGVARWRLEPLRKTGRGFRGKATRASPPQLAPARSRRSSSRCSRGRAGPAWTSSPPRRDGCRTPPAPP
jgi:transposase